MPGNFVEYGRILFRFFFCFLSFFIFFLVSGLSYSLLIFYKSSRRRSLMTRLVQLFVRCLVFIMGVKIDIEGNILHLNPDHQGAFFVSNHLSYLDGFVLGSLFPVVYVTKMELKKWPLIGFMVEISGTLFVDRNHKDCLLGVIQEIADTLKDGGNVLYFPEGTSSNGDCLLSFVPTFFEAPLVAGARIVPVTLVYRAIDGSPIVADNRDKVYWYGEMTFMGHFFALLSCRSVEVDAKVHSYLESPDTDDNFSRRMQRKQVCELAREAVAKGFYENKKNPELNEVDFCVSADLT